MSNYLIVKYYKVIVNFCINYLPLYLSTT